MLTTPYKTTTRILDRRQSEGKEEDIGYITDVAAATCGVKRVTCSTSCNTFKQHYVYRMFCGIPNNGTEFDYPVLKKVAMEVLLYDIYSTEELDKAMQNCNDTLALMIPSTPL